MQTNTSKTNSPGCFSNSLQAQLQAIKQDIVTNTVSYSQDVQFSKQAPSRYIWRIARNQQRFDRFDVIETKTQAVLYAGLDIEEAQEMVDLHNQQVEAWFAAHKAS